ncbi:hypothetical protein [Streptomyces sp. CB01580]|uniref:hypothetical protein n=1 Tax=Streptomyces sp. CB01580 TaxID=1703933 RepID=UPI00093DE422|nr:hypothetical protein [Streptomyces sp. CB01580]
MAAAGPGPRRHRHHRGRGPQAGPGAGPDEAGGSEAPEPDQGDSRTPDLPKGAFGPARPCPWWHEVNTYAFQSAFIDADRAWANWLDSLRGRRAGRRVGYPRFKKKGRARDAFRLHHDVKKPSIRTAGYRRLRMPTIGEVRFHDSAKRMARLVDRGQAVVQSVTVSRAGHRWYASVLCKVTTDLPDRPTRRQAERGTVGVESGPTLCSPPARPAMSWRKDRRGATCCAS